MGYRITVRSSAARQRAHARRWRPSHHQHADVVPWVQTSPGDRARQTPDTRLTDPRLH